MLTDPANIELVISSDVPLNPQEYYGLALLFIEDSSILSKRVSFVTSLANLMENRVRTALIFKSWYFKLWLNLLET